MRRAATSIPSNIAEGWGRGPGKEFPRHLRIARGSLFELNTQLQLSEKIGYLDRDSIEEILIDISSMGRMLLSLMRSLDEKQQMPR